MSFNPGEVISGKYQIIDFIGGGAMGAVYKAENLNMHKPVAIKVLHGDFAENEEYKKRFFREARSAATLEHSNICTIMDYDTAPTGESYIVMELLSGETLKKRLERLTSLSPLSAVRIMRQLMGALSCAHEKGIVHRDVKPDNIFLIQREGVDDFVKLIDFGIAHMDNQDGDLKTLTQVGQIYGTPQYISPEQAEGDPVDHRADLYAAGVIFYEMLTGKAPFEGKNYIELLMKQVNEPAPHIPKEIVQSERMDEIIQRLMAKKPDQRYNSAIEVISLLDEILYLLSGGGSESGLSSRSVSITLNNLKAEAAEGGSVMSGLPQNSQQWKVVLLLALVIAFALIVAWNFIRSAKDAITDRKTDIVEQVATSDDDQKDESAAENELTPYPYNVDAVNFGVSLEDVLAKDTKIKMAVDEFAVNNRHEAAYQLLSEVKEKYWNHPNFLRLYVMACYRQIDKLATADEKNSMLSELVYGMIQLMQIEPNAFRNEGMRNIFYELIDANLIGVLDKRFHAFEKESTGNSAIALSWAIIKTDYDQNDGRREDMLKLLDSLHTESVPSWLRSCVSVMKIDKTKCSERDQLMNLLAGANNDSVYVTIYEEFIGPMSKRTNKSCKNGKKVEDCNACLKKFFATAAEKYEQRKAIELQNRAKTDGQEDSQEDAD